MVCLSAGAIKANLSHFQQVHNCKQLQLSRGGCSLFSCTGNCAIAGKKCKVRGLPQQAEVTQGGPGRLRPRVFLTFGTTRVVGSQPYSPAAFTPGEIPGTHF